MKKCLGTVAAVSAVALAFAVPASAAAPANDNFANATLLTPTNQAVTVPGTTDQATAQPSEPAHAGFPASQSVWFKYIPATSQRIQLSDCDNVQIDSDFAVYTGSALASLNPVISSSTAPFAGDCGARAAVEFNVTGGTTYYIAEDRETGGTGPFTLNLFEHIPTATIDSGPAGDTTDTTATFTFHADVAGAGFMCGVVGPGGGLSNDDDCGTSGSFTSPPLALGAWEFHVIPYNSTNGAVSIFSIKRDFNVVNPPPPPDTMAPDTKIDSGPKKKTSSKTARFEFSSTEAGSTFECKLNGGSFKPCGSPDSFKAAKGRNVFEVRATDSAGNVDVDPASYTWTYKKKHKKKHHH